MSLTRARLVAASGFGRVPVGPIVIGLGLFGLLVAFIGADPPSRMTFSSSPFTDEAFNTVNARNLVQLGTWSTDEWNLHLVNLPFSVARGDRLPTRGRRLDPGPPPRHCLRGPDGRGPRLGPCARSPVGRLALLAGLAFATSGLVLFYGRLAYVEDLVVLALTIGTLVIVTDRRLTLRWGLLSGVCYAVAIGAKPSAAVAATGIVLALALVWSLAERAVRRWILGVVAAVVFAGLAWVVVIWLPNRDAVAMDLRIWEQIQFSLAPADAIHSIWRYVVSENDHLYGPLLGPLLFLGGASVPAIAALRRRLNGAEARLVVACLGWLILGFGVLLIASYRPNRYVVPLVPPLAILTAIATHRIGEWLTERFRAPAAPSTVEREAEDPDLPGGDPATHPRSRGLWGARRLVAPAFVVLVTVVAVTPGLVWYASWASNATYELPRIQDRLASVVPEGERVAGRESALYLMKSKAVTLITQPGGGAANNGDLYAGGVRWYVLPADDPAPFGVSAAVWSSRERIFCAEYGNLNECLFHVR